MRLGKSTQAIAGILALSTMVGGTYAWQAFSQRALNEMIGGESSVGARLHDDFNGENKDIYVENYTSVGGENVYTRVRLQEYMEYGKDAGVLTVDGRDDSNITMVRGMKAKDASLPSIDDPSTWDLYLYNSTASIESVAIAEYKTLHFGNALKANQGAKVYMPTFLKDTEDLTSDVKGAIDDGGNRYDGINTYSEYTTYKLGESLTATAIYDTTDNTKDETETHIAKSTLTATVISMDEWVTAGCNPGNYWVYDVDGWAYWADGLAPQTATGLLVDSVSTIKKPDTDWHYGLHVVAQTATAGDWGDEDATDDIEKGMYADGITTEGLHLLNTISISDVSTYNELEVQSSEDESNVESQNTSANIPSESEERYDTVNIGGVDFYVLDNTTVTAVDENGYSTGTMNAKLIWAVDSIGAEVYNQTGNILWSDSYLRNNVLDTWLESNEELANLAIRVPIVTDGYYSSKNSIVSTENVYEVTYDKIFVFSQVEIMKTYGLESSYTSKGITSTASWLRTANTANTLRQLDGATGLISEVGKVTTTTAEVRPALWITY